MERLERILFMLDNSISTNKRRHIAGGGVLFSISLLFGGLAITVISLKIENQDEYEKIYLE